MKHDQQEECLHRLEEFVMNCRRGALLITRLAMEGRPRHSGGGFTVQFQPGNTPVEWLPRSDATASHGLPPVGTTQDSGLLIRYLNPRPKQWEILAHKGDEAVLYDTTNPEQTEVYLMTADCFTTEQRVKDREQLIDVIGGVGTAAERADALLEVGWHR